MVYRITQYFLDWFLCQPSVEYKECEESIIYKIVL